MRAADLVSACWFWIGAAVVTPAAAEAATAEALNAAGKTAYGRGDYATAVDLFAQAIAQDASAPLFHYHRAVALTRLHRWDDARAAYLTAQRLGPSPPLAALVRDGLRALPATGRPTQSGAGDSISVALRAFRGIWLTEAVVNGQRSARVVVDTGATLCVLSPKFAATMGIEPAPDARVIELQTLNGRASGRLVSIGVLQVGEARAKDVAAVILDMGADVDGILGNSFLARFAVTLDAARGVLHLRPRRFGQESMGRERLAWRGREP
jgi:clan AA aspartic protease (TIGR02281 family)